MYIYAYAGSNIQSIELCSPIICRSVAEDLDMLSSVRNVSIFKGTIKLYLF